MTKKSQQPQPPEFSVSLGQIQEWGAQLRAARERRGKSVAEMSVITRIREGFLQGIEDGHWDVLPPGLSGRGLVRNYAKELAVPLGELEPRARTVSVAQQEAAQAQKQVHAWGGGKPAQIAKETPSQQQQRVPAPESAQRSAQRVAAQHDAAVSAVLPFQRSRSAGTGSGAPLSGVISTPDPLDVLGLLPLDTPPLTPGTPQNPAARSDAVGVPPIHQAEAGGATPVVVESPRSSVPVPSPEEAIETVMASTIAPVPERVRYEPPSVSALPDNVVSLPVAPAPASLAADTVPVRRRSRMQIPWAALVLTLIIAGAVALFLWSKSKNDPDDSLPLADVPAGAPASEAAGVASPAPAAVSDAVPQQEGNKSGSAEQLPAAGSALLPAGSAAAVATPVASAATQVSPTPSADAAAVAPVTSATPVAAVPSPPTPSQATPVAAATPAAEVSAPQTNDKNPSQSAGAGGATLVVETAVQMTVIADGQTLFQGVREPGDFKISFAKRAEILVQDGSKVKLRYGTWDHGPLGHPGRQRRLTLLPYELQ